MTFRLQKLDIGCLIFILVVCLNCGVWVAGQIVRQKKLLRQENALIAKRLKDLNMAETNLQHLKEALDAARNKLRVLNEQIPGSAEIGTFLKQIDALIKKRGLALITVQPLAAVKEKRFTRIPIRMLFKGSFVNLYQLLYDLETMNRLVEMKNMHISKVSIDFECRVELTADVFQR